MACRSPREFAVTNRVKILVSAMMAAGSASVWLALGHPARHWVYFGVYLAAVLLSSGMKVAMPKSNGTMSVNFPFILLGILELSPLQAAGLAIGSVLAQCRFQEMTRLRLVQILFNLANVTTATVLAWTAYAGSCGAGVEMAPALAIAAVVYFLSNSIPVALILAWESGKSPVAQWREEFPWYLPFYLVGAALAVSAHWIGHEFGWVTSLLLIPIVYTIYRAYRAQGEIIRDRERHILENEALQLRTIEGLAMAIEAKDRNTHQHLMRVRIYVAEIGTLLRLDAVTMQALQTASFLHDIGKLAVPEHILNKPGKLTPEEFEKIKIHPVVGADILDRVRFPYPVVPIVRSHHEAWDGSGYPDGLKGEEIPIGARILSMVDCFDALASERPYRRALPLDEAMAMVKAKAGIQFDPKLVALLERHYLELEAKARHRMEEMSPLNTELFIPRGAAPAAGFEPGHTAVAEKSRAAAVSNSDLLPKMQPYYSLDLMASASKEAKALFELSHMLGSSLSVRETSSMLSHHLKCVLPFDCLAVYLKADASLALHFLDGPYACAFSPQPIALGEGLSGWVAQSNRPILNGNPTVEPNYGVETGLFTGTSSALSLPLTDGTGVVFGVLTLYCAQPAAYCADHLGILQALEPKFSLSLQNALRFSSAETDAMFDYLTQLPNMRQFFTKMQAEIQSARARQSSFSLIVCDLNAFKAVNDRYGHLTGNELLKRIAAEFRACCRAEDTVARLGGDEFVFLLSAADARSAYAQMARIGRAVEQACLGMNMEVGISTSAGLAVYPVDGETPEELLGTADRRMYQEKRASYAALDSGEVQPSQAGLAQV